MLQGIVSFLSEKTDTDKFILNSLNPPTFEKNIPYQVVWSPENYFIQKVTPFIDLDHIGRVYAFIIISWILFNYLLFQAFSRCLIKNSAILGYFSRLQNTKAIIITGGGYLNSLWWLDGLYAKACFTIVAKIAKVPVILTSQGLGPYTHPLDKLAAKILFKAASYIGVRDANESGSLVNSLAKKHYYHTGDDALLLTNLSDSKLLKIIHRNKIPENKILVGVNLRDSSEYSKQHNKPFIKNYVEFLDKLIEEKKFHLVFIPISYNDSDGDHISAKKIHRRLKNKNAATIISEELKPNEIKSLISIMNYSIGISYHFLLFSISQGVPSIGLYQNEYYKKKLTGLFNLYGVNEYCVDINNHDSKYIVNLFNEIIAKRNHINLMLKKNSDDLVTVSNAAHEKIIKVLAN